MNIETVRLTSMSHAETMTSGGLVLLRRLTVEQNAKINFLHPSGPARSFRWPKKPDVCWVGITNVICQVQVPVTATGRTYKIDDQESRNINAKFLIK